MPSYNLSVQPTQLAHLDSEQEVTIRVLGAGTVLFAQSLSDCQNGVGISYTSADNLQKQKWSDELWATCDDPTTKVQIVFPAQGNSTSYVYTPNSRNSIVKLLVDGAKKQSTSTCDKSLSLKSAFSKLIGRNVFKLLLFALLARSLYSQVDVIVPVQVSPFQKIQVGAIWGNSGNGGFNNTFILTPPPNSPSLCLLVVNNSSQSRSFNITVYGTPVPSDVTPTASLKNWIRLAISPATSNTYRVVNSQNLGIPIRTSGNAHIAIVLTNSVNFSNQTEDIYGVYGSDSVQCGNIYSGSTGLDTFEAQSYIYKGFASTSCVVNPAANFNLYTLIATNSTINSLMLFKSVTISSTVAAEIDVTEVNSQGNNCTNVVNGYVPSNIRSGASQPSGGTLRIQGPCTMEPSFYGPVDSLLIGASNPFTLDLHGFWTSFNSGLDVGLKVTNPLAITGTVCVNFKWAEY